MIITTTTKQKGWNIHITHITISHSTLKSRPTRVLGQFLRDMCDMSLSHVIMWVMDKELTLVLLETLQRIEQKLDLIIYGADEEDTEPPSEGPYGRERSDGEVL